MLSCRMFGCTIRVYLYSSMDGQAQTTLRSPKTLSMRATGGQYLFSRTHGSGYAACSREYGRSHSVRVTASAVCGAFLSGIVGAVGCGPPRCRVFPAEWRSGRHRSDPVPLSIRFPSARSSTCRGTGHEMVGGWNPKSIRRLATSSTVMPALACNGRKSRMHSCATSPFVPRYSTGNARPAAAPHSWRSEWRLP